MDIIEKIKAHFRAKKQFFDSLTPLEKSYYTAFKAIVVVGNVSKQKYIIYTDRGLVYNVYRMSDDLRICLKLKDVSFWSAILTQKLMLECNEAEALDKASGTNRSVTHEL